MLPQIVIGKGTRHEKGWRKIYLDTVSSECKVSKTETSLVFEKQKKANRSEITKKELKKTGSHSLPD